MSTWSFRGCRRTDTNKSPFFLQGSRNMYRVKNTVHAMGTKQTSAVWSLSPCSCFQQMQHPQLSPSQQYHTSELLTGVNCAQKSPILQNSRSGPLRHWGAINCNPVTTKNGSWRFVPVLPCFHDFGDDQQHVCQLQLECRLSSHPTVNISAV